MLALKTYSSKLFFCLHSPIMYFDSNRRIALSLSAQRSILATSIIREIMNSSPPTGFHQPSLRDKILLLNPLINGQEISQQIKNEIFGLFTTGIPLNSDIFTQSRIQQAWQPMEKGQKVGKLIFCPNYLTTRQIFKIMLQNQQAKILKNKNIFITGGFGISKTISIILYIHLSYYIHKYYQEAHENRNEITNLIHYKQYNSLMSSKLIEIVPKVWYWSIDIQQHGDQSFRIQDLILKQTKDLSDSKRTNLQNQIKQGSIFQFKQQLKKSYLGIHIKSIVDQTNAMASIARKYNINKDKGLKENQSFKISQKQLSDKFQALLNHLEKYKKCADHCVFNSSINIQQNLLIPSTDQYLGLGINRSHHKLKFVPIEYQKLLAFEDWAKIDFWHFFWFQIQRSLKDKNLLLKINDIKAIFFEKCAQKAEVKSYYRFIYIKSFLDEKLSIFNQINQNTSKQQLEQKISEIIQNFNGHCLASIEEKLKIFLQKGSLNERNYKKVYLSQLHYYASNLCRQKQKVFNVQRKDFEQFIKSWIEKESINNIADKFDKQILNFQKIKNDPTKIKLVLSPEEIVQILTIVLYPRVIDYIPLGKNFIQIIRDHQASKGFFIQFSLLACLNVGTKFDFQISGIQKQFGQYQLGITNQIFQIQDRVQFTSLRIQTQKQTKNEKKKQQKQKTGETKETGETQKIIVKQTQDKNPFQIEKNFAQLLQACKTKMLYNIVAIPFNYKYGQYIFDGKSPSIDFIIASYETPRNQFVFYTFDLTIARSSQSIQDKRESAIQLFQKLLSKDKDFPIIIKHVILCPKISIPLQIKSFRKQVTIKDSRLSICYADRQKLILSSESLTLNNNIRAFQQMLKIYKNIEQEDEIKKKKLQKKK